MNVDELTEPPPMPDDLRYVVGWWHTFYLHPMLQHAEDTPERVAAAKAAWLAIDQICDRDDLDVAAQCARTLLRSGGGRHTIKTSAPVLRRLYEFCKALKLIYR